MTPRLEQHRRFPQPGSASAPGSVQFVTRFFGAARLGVGKYEESLYPHLAALADVKQVSIAPLPVPSAIVTIGRILGRDLRAVAANYPLHVTRGMPAAGLVHLSNELLAPALLCNRGQAIITVHHLPGIGDPELCVRARDRAISQILLVVSLRKASRVIADSNWTATEVVVRGRVPAHRVDVVPLGVDHERFRPIRVAAYVRRKYCLSGGPHMLYVGGFGPRKNVSVLVAAFRIVKTHIPTAELLLVGPSDANTHKVLKESASAGYRYLGYIPTEDLAALYSFVDVSIMPSRLEGFSLPVLEAMACGCPVIAARASALPELVENTGLLFDPDDPIELSRHLIHVLSQPEIRARMSRQSLEQAGKYDWRKTAELTVASYRRAVPALFGAKRATRVN